MWKHQSVSIISNDDFEGAVSKCCVLVGNLLTYPDEIGQANGKLKADYVGAEKYVKILIFTLLIDGN